MAGEKCPNCHKGFLLRKGDRTKVQCSVCGYWKYRSPKASSRGSLVGALNVEKKEEKETEDIPKVEEKLYMNDPDYVRKKAYHDQNIQSLRREFSIQKMIKKLRKRGKYSGLGETIIIDGEVFDIKTGERIGTAPENIAEEVG